MIKNQHLKKHNNSGTQKKILLEFLFDFFGNQIQTLSSVTHQELRKFSFESGGNLFQTPSSFQQSLTWVFMTVGISSSCFLIRISSLSISDFFWSLARSAIRISIQLLKLPQDTWTILLVILVFRYWLSIKMGKNLQCVPMYATIKVDQITLRPLLFLLPSITSIFYLETLYYIIETVISLWTLMFIYWPGGWLVCVDRVS